MRGAKIIRPPPPKSEPPLSKKGPNMGVSNVTKSELIYDYPQYANLQKFPYVFHSEKRGVVCDAVYI